MGKPEGGARMLDGSPEATRLDHVKADRARFT
jgi:hypothetical protein